VGRERASAYVPRPLTAEERQVAEQAIRDMVDRIVRDFDPLKVILFGSFARGDVTYDSDVDLLVVLPHVENKREMRVAIRRALRRAPVAKDIIVTTPEEIERRGDIVGTILRPALREGVTLYERG
jgi:predicted nucleotidyltransferase